MPLLNNGRDSASFDGDDAVTDYGHLHHAYVQPSKRNDEDALAGKAGSDRGSASGCFAPDRATTCFKRRLS